MHEIHLTPRPYEIREVYRKPLSCYSDFKKGYISSSNKTHVKGIEFHVKRERMGVRRKNIPCFRVKSSKLAGKYFYFHITKFGWEKSWVKAVRYFSLSNNKYNPKHSDWIPPDIDRHYF